MRRYAEIVAAFLSFCFCLGVFARCAAACRRQGRSLPCFFVFPTHPWRHALHMAPLPIAPRARFRGGILAGRR